MQFTPQEMKLIERLRKQERLWPRTRWIFLGTAAFILAVYGYIAYFLFSTLDSQTFSPADSALLFAFLWPKARKKQPEMRTSANHARRKSGHRAPVAMMTVVAEIGR